MRADQRPRNFLFSSVQFNLFEYCQRNTKLVFLCGYFIVVVERLSYPFQRTISAGKENKEVPCIRRHLKFSLHLLDDCGPWSRGERSIICDKVPFILWKLEFSVLHLHSRVSRVPLHDWKFTLFIYAFHVSCSHLSSLLPSCFGECTNRKNWVTVDC